MHVKSTNNSKTPVFAALAMLSERIHEPPRPIICFSVVFVSSHILRFYRSQVPGSMCKQASINQTPNARDSSHLASLDYNLEPSLLVSIVRFALIHSTDRSRSIVVLLSILESAAVAFLLDLLLLVVPVAQVLEQPVEVLADTNSH